MEGDSIRANGTKVVVGIWIDGAMRSISVTRAAIAGRVGREKAATMSDDERCAFVRTNLPLVVSAATVLLEGKGATENITLGGGSLVVSEGGRVGDRRRSDRRKSERRRRAAPGVSPTQREHRHIERRKTDRRQPADPAEA